LSNEKASNKHDSAPINKLSGNIIKPDLIGPLKSRPISELVRLFDNRAVTLTAIPQNILIGKVDSVT
jgi:hypothetical protein